MKTKLLLAFLLLLVALFISNPALACVNAMEGHETAENKRLRKVDTVHIEAEPLVLDTRERPKAKREAKAASTETEQTAKTRKSSPNRKSRARQVETE